MLGRGILGVGMGMGRGCGIDDRVDCANNVTSASPKEGRMSGGV